MHRSIDSDIGVCRVKRQFLDGDAGSRRADGDRSVGVNPYGVFDFKPLAGEAVRAGVIEPEAVVVGAPAGDAFGLLRTLRHRKVVDLVRASLRHGVAGLPLGGVEDVGAERGDCPAHRAQSLVNMASEKFVGTVGDGR